MNSERRQIHDEQKYIHFVTFGVDRRRRMLDLDDAKRLFLGIFSKVLNERSAHCTGFVLMPDHVHLLIWFDCTGQLSRFLHELKRRSSLQLRKWYATEHPEYTERFPDTGRFWQREYHSFEIECVQKLEEKLAYLHMNPVRAGLTKSASDWKWSSARWYLDGRAVGIPLKWPC